MLERETSQIYKDKNVLEEARDCGMRSAKVTIRDIMWQMQKLHVFPYFRVNRGGRILSSLYSFK